MPGEGGSVSLRDLGVRYFLVDKVLGSLRVDLVAKEERGPWVFPRGTPVLLRELGVCGGVSVASQDHMQTVPMPAPCLSAHQALRVAQAEPRR